MICLNFVEKRNGSPCFWKVILPFWKGFDSSSTVTYTLSPEVMLQLFQFRIINLIIPPNWYKFVPNKGCYIRSYSEKIHSCWLHYRRECLIASGTTIYIQQYTALRTQRQTGFEPRTLHPQARCPHHCRKEHPRSLLLLFTVKME